MFVSEVKQHIMYGAVFGQVQGQVSLWSCGWIEDPGLHHCQAPTFHRQPLLRDSQPQRAARQAQLHGCAQLWAPEDKRNKDLLEQVQREQQR